MKKLLVLGDSLSLPRLQPEMCAYEDTWPVLLKQHFEVHQVSLGGGTIGDVLRQVEYHKVFAPEVVVIQCGIVDCAPRALSEFELEFIKKLWGIRSILLPLIKKYSRQLRALRNTTYTSPQKFKNSIVEIKSLFPNATFWVIGILPSCEEYEKRVPGISARIGEFNELLKSAGDRNYISVDDISREAVMSDFIHLNPSGQRFVFEKIMTLLKSNPC